MQPRFATYSDFAEALLNTNYISDPWLDGRERFRLQPVFLHKAIYAELCRAAESIGALYDELCRLILNNPAYLDFFHLTPFERLMWYASGGEWHGIARLDLFILSDGTIRTCEMNSDTPSGEAEAMLVNELLHYDYPETWNPNTNFVSAFIEMIRSFSVAGNNNNAAIPRIGILYPTEQPEDLSMILCYRAWLEAAGFDVVFGAPYNLHTTDDGALALFGKKVDIIFRHYKTDWWAERESAWRDGVAFPDPDPLYREIALVVEALSEGKVRVINPFGAVLTQNKLTMAFFYMFFSLFSSASQDTIRRYIPSTKRLCDIVEGEEYHHLLANKNMYVLKSDYGCEGDEVIIGRGVSDEIWQRSVREAVSTRWIVQDFFDAAPEANNTIPNYGIYLLGGKASGVYTRLSPLQTDYRSLSVATFIHT